MDYVAITLVYPVKQGEDISKDLLLPLDLPQYVLVGSVVQSLNIEVPTGYRGDLSILAGKYKIPFLSQKTLRVIGVKFGDYLILEFKKAARAFLSHMEGLQFELEENEINIGRRSDMNVNLRGIQNEDYVSGHHAKILYTNGHYSLVDLGSLNGTRLNNILIPQNQEVLIKDEDIILLGSTRENGIELTLKIRN